MAKRPLDYREVFAETMRLTGSIGALLNGVDASGRVNTMTIGWATLGIIWGKPIASVLVRPSRYTYTFVEATPDFTINVLGEEHASALGLCGSVSGRDHDKFAETGLTLAPAEKVRTPIVEQARIVFECATVHRHDLDPAALSEQIVGSYYPQGDFHRVYHGEIVACYGDL